MAKIASKSVSLSNSSQKPPFFAVLLYALYGQPRYFKFKRKYQQHSPCFPTICPFLMTMAMYNVLVGVSYRTVFIAVTNMPFLANEFLIPYDLIKEAPGTQNI